MKIFVSHQLTDTPLAESICNRLEAKHSIRFYLDAVDPVADETGDDLGEHLQIELGKCTHLLAVVSEHTKTSWWVPWEIGVSTEKSQPIASYAGGQTELPEYLKKWPYLQSLDALAQYADVSKQAEGLITRDRSNGSTIESRKQATASFYKNLRARLGQ